MSPGVQIAFAGGTAQVVAGDELHQFDGWRATFRGAYKDHRYYELIEQTLDCGFEHQYIVLRNDSGLVRAIQPVFFVRQNLVEGVPALNPAIAALRRAFPKLLTMQVLMVGCAAGEGGLAVCDSADEQWVADALHAVLARYARSCNASLVVLKDFPISYREALRPFSSNGYLRLPSMPMTLLRFEQSDFDAYVRTLGASTRKDLRRKFRKATKAPPLTMEVTSDVSSCVEELYPLYLQVHERAKMKFERLTKAYFLGIGRSMPDRARFFLWRQEGRLVAFSLCLVQDETIYDECLGLDYAVALDLHLYFQTLRDIITWSLAHGLKRYCSGPLNYHPKLHLGCDLMPLDLYVMHTNRLMNPIFRRAARFLGPTRHDPVLRKFRNAHEL